MSTASAERQPKECAGSRKEKERKETKKNKKKGKERRLVRYRAERARAKGKGEGCHSHAPTLNEHSPSAFPLQAGGRRILVSLVEHGRPWSPLGLNHSLLSIFLTFVFLNDSSGEDPLG